MEKPILFSTEMVRAILEGRKNQTRRVIKPQPDHFHRDIIGKEPPYKAEDWNTLLPQIGKEEIRCPYGKPGDILWVRETWGIGCKGNYDKDGYLMLEYCYKATDDDLTIKSEFGKSKWRPSIHMPRAAARLFLKVKSVRVERLQDITLEDAKAEGMSAINGFLLDRSSKWCEYTIMAAKMQGREIPKTADYIGGFAYIWDQINSKRGFSWSTNPWVWVIEFERVS